MNRLMICLALAALGGCGKTPEQISLNKESPLSIRYPETRGSTVTDIYFGTEVADPYRWLEDDRSEETAAWVARQNEVTFGYLEKIPYREALESRITELMNYERVSAPRNEGRYTYFYRNTGLQDQDVVYRQQGKGEPEVFLDPNSLSDDGTTSLASLSFSEDGRIAAYTVSEAGSDWRKATVIDVETREVLEAPLVDLKFTGLSWRGNEGFYYSKYEKPDGSELSAKTDQHMVYFHRLGEPQGEDELIFGATAEQKHRYVFGSVSEDDRFLTISASQTTSGNKLFVKDLADPDSPLMTVVDDEDSDIDLIANDGDRLIFFTNRDAPNGRIVAVSAQASSPDNWEEVVAETDNVLVASSGGGYLFAEYMVDALSRIYQYDYEGKRIREISLPGPGSASTPGGKREDDVLYYSFTNYVLPSTIFALDVATGKSSVYRSSSAPFDSDNYVSEQVFYTSKDGTRVPMLISHRRDMKRDGTNPTMLYGYGGFNVSLTPGYSTTFAAWMEQGGVVAVPNLRGGGEYGKAWHLGGTLFNKQNVFDDFIAAGEYLIREKYTSSARLVLRGGSNGGLLVGAVMTQRPDLAAVALPAVGVLDMLRYHTFTAGAGWAYDYGTSEQSEEMFEYLRGYSPLHNLEEGDAYPATLVTTSDHDDRVVPAHSFKFAAALQSAHGGNEPVMIRIETSAGHGAGKPVSKQIEGLADELSFAFFNTGYTPDRLDEN